MEMALCYHQPHFSSCVMCLFIKVTHVSQTHFQTPLTFFFVHVANLFFIKIPTTTHTHSGSSHTSNPCLQVSCAEQYVKNPWVRVTLKNKPSSSPHPSSLRMRRWKVHNLCRVKKEKVEMCFIPEGFTKRANSVSDKNQGKKCNVQQPNRGTSWKMPGFRSFLLDYAARNFKISLAF